VWWLVQTKKDGKPLPGETTLLGVYRIVAAVVVGAMIVTFPLGVRAYGGCDPVCDYTNPQHVRENLPVVERHHFNADVEQLRATMPGGYIAEHLWYVIRAFPNHHRALYSFTKYWRQHLQRGKTPKGIDPSVTAEFVLDRAMKFAPQDGMVRLLYGFHLQKLGKLDEALVRYKEAEKLIPNSAELHYNLGLLYIDKEEYGLALLHAQTAYKLGYPLPGLKHKLVAAGVWKP
jgi:hypothetical protein